MTPGAEAFLVERASSELDGNQNAPNRATLHGTREQAEDLGPPAREPDHRAESRALGILAHEMVARPDGVLQRLSELVVELCRAGSAGVSILEPDGASFRWQAVAGPLAARLAGATIAREVSPCDVAIGRDSVLLLTDLRRDFPALVGRIEPPVFEALLVPLHANGRAIGTVWAATHDPDRHFDAEDARLLASLARFASAARQMAVALDQAEAARAELERQVRERTQAEARLQAAHQHNTEILESLADAFYAVDRDWRFTYVNHKAEERWGLSRGSLLGRVIWEVFPQMAGGGPEQALRRAMRDRRPLHVEAVSRSLGHWVEMDIHPTAAGGLSVYLRDIQERKRAEERQALLAREVDHRAKNALAVVQAAVRLTRAEDVKGYVRALEGRIAALARAQTLLAQDRWAGADLRALVRGELKPFLGGNRQRAVLDGPPMVLPPGAAQPLAMAVHELATNALKHGALSVEGGRVAVSWRAVGRAASRMLRLRWVETGGPPVPGVPTRRGFGTRVVDATIRRQLGGTVSLAWEAQGLICDIELPLTRAPGPGRGAAATGAVPSEPPTPGSGPDRET
ncbi:MAG: HWE histidine kinase domain-containing protein [Acetobacteraceae bacterium]|nr:HWE histidine kinase domain-containing protein [Acetobacteraceae bacterium]